jgi:pyruvate kinase
MAPTRKTKILATLGPASSAPDTIHALVAAGADAFRFNLSHGNRDDHRARYEAVRALELEGAGATSVVADLQGPKLRIGTFSGGGTNLEAGQNFRLDLKAEPGNDTRVTLPHAKVFAALDEGAAVLVDDGRIRLEVQSVTAEGADTVVRTGGALSDNKGINVPGVTLPLKAMTPKDQADLDFALDLGADWIALSFVQRPEDVAEARKLIAGRAGLISKIEKPGAIEHLDDIIELSDGIMVARGDLGVEMPIEDVPGLQKRIVRAARAAGKPVIVATQMLDSMIQAPTPTRAEVSDVATAVYDGADAVMLSAESAVGAFPIETVHTMSRIAERTEADPLYRAIIEASPTPTEASAADTISRAAVQVAEDLGAAVIVTFTTTGSTSLRAARQRPSVPLLVLTPRHGTTRRLAILWGATCATVGDITNFDEMVSIATKVATREGLAKPGQRLVVTAGVPFGTPGATNVLRIAQVGRGAG